MFNPAATYRIQFHKQFNFDAFEKTIPYLQKLGISSIYASPIFAAVPDSMHGYDGINPYCINPEIGTEEQLRTISKQLKEAGIGWIQDIVPNHMAFDPRNTLLADVLRKGQQSEFADFFDIDWVSKIYNGRLMAPFLGTTLEEAIEKDELKINENADGYYLQYYESKYPLNESSVRLLKENHLNKELILKIAESQHYRLCHWQETDKQINYRRFFTINGLICLNIHKDKVFSFYHRKIKELIDDKIFDGLRIDHIDGLYDPTKYLNDLRAMVGAETYIIVEKILERHESLPEHWPVQGTSGYDYLAISNNLFTNKKASY